jgi:hypothetical protein
VIVIRCETRDGLAAFRLEASRGVIEATKGLKLESMTKAEMSQIVGRTPVAGARHGLLRRTRAAEGARLESAAPLGDTHSDERPRSVDISVGCKHTLLLALVNMYEEPAIGSAIDAELQAHVRANGIDNFYVLQYVHAVEDQLLGAIHQLEAGEALEVGLGDDTCHSTLLLTAIGWHSLGIYTVSLQSLRSTSFEMTVSPVATRSCWSGQRRPPSPSTRSGPARGGWAPLAFSTVILVSMALLYGRTGRLTAKNGAFRPGQVEESGVISFGWVQARP